MSYILNLEKEFSLIENGFKEQEIRALADYKAKGAERRKEFAYLAYSSKLYQARIYTVFFFGYLSERK
jgi:heat repeat domain protein